MRGRAASLWWIVSLVFAACGPSDNTSSSDPYGRSHPELFDMAEPCTSGTRPLDTARVAEERARYRYDRYPYDPRDGVFSVRQLGAAASCYALAGRHADAVRVDALRRLMVERISSDYAAARLNLRSAIDRF